MKKAEQKSKQPEYASRIAGKRIIPPPTPRPIPLDHPASALFGTVKTEKDAVSNPTANKDANSQPPTEAPIQTPTDATTFTPTETPTDTTTATPIETATVTPTALPPPQVKIAPTQKLKRQTNNEEAGKVAEPPTEIVRKFEYLDATHTSSEQIVYSYMYRQTISQNVRERHFGPKELLVATPIRSHVTIRKAIDGLINKLSIQIVKFVNGSPFGPRYRIYDPREIMNRRQKAGIQIDPVTKQIYSQDSSANENLEDELHDVSTTTATPTITPTTSPSTDPYNPYSDPVKNCRGTPTKIGGVTPTEIVGVYINSKDYLEAGDNTASSSSKSVTAGQARSEDEDNDEDGVSISYLDQIRETYERATGNSWTTADAETVMRAKDIPVEVWGIAICYCLDRAPNHSYQRLAYVLEEARTHYETMNSFSQGDLRAILKHYLRTLDRVRATGSWDPSVVAKEKQRDDFES